DGAITFTDQDFGDVHQASFAPKNGGAGYVGTFTLDPVSETNGNGSVRWHFTATAAELQSIAPGQTHVYTASIKDHGGATITQDVTVTLPVNDPPTIWAVSTLHFWSSANSTPINEVIFSDTDLTHNVTVTMSVPAGQGTFSFIEDPNVTETLSADQRTL